MRNEKQFGSVGYDAQAYLNLGEMSSFRLLDEF